MTVVILDPITQTVALTTDSCETHLWRCWLRGHGACEERGRGRGQTCVGEREEGRRGKEVACRNKTGLAEEVTTSRGTP